MDFNLTVLNRDPLEEYSCEVMKNLKFFREYEHCVKCRKVRDKKSGDLLGILNEVPIEFTSFHISSKCDRECYGDSANYDIKISRIKREREGCN